MRYQAGVLYNTTEVLYLLHEVAVVYSLLPVFSESSQEHSAVWISCSDENNQLCLRHVTEMKAALVHHCHL